MATVIPKSELVRRAVDWIFGEEGGVPSAPERKRRLIDEAAARFNLSPLEVEALERFLNSRPAGR